MKEVDSILQEKIHYALSSSMSLNNVIRAKKLFDEYRDNIDVMHNEGEYIRLSVRYQNSEMLEALLKLFEETKIEKDSLSLKSIYARHELREVLRDAIDQYETTEEIDKLTSEYLPSKDEEDVYEQDLTGFEEELGELGKHDNEHYENYDENYHSKAIVGQDILKYFKQETFKTKVK